MRLRSLIDCLFYARPEKLFLYLALWAGLALIFITPPFQSPDEPNHFFRAYQVSTLKILPEAKNNRIGGELPENLDIYFRHFYILQPDEKISPEKILESFSIPLDKQNTKHIHFPNTARFTHLNYLPQSIAIFVGRLFNASPAIMFYLARIANLMLWISLIFFSIKTVPVYKHLFLVLALLPMHISLAASISADTFTNGIAFLFSAICIKHAFDKNYYVDKKQIMVLLSLVFLLAVLKNSYFLIIFLFFLIPKNKFVYPITYRQTKVLVIVTGLVGMAIANTYTGMVYRLIGPGTSFFPHFTDAFNEGGYDSQLKYILAQPFNYIQIMLRSFWVEKTNLFESFFGNLGWLDTPLPKRFYSVSLAFLIILGLIDGHGKTRLGVLQKAGILLVIITTVALIATASYITWTPVGKDLIEGLQGRYFIPLSPLLFMLFQNTRIKAPNEMVFFFSAIFVIHACMLTLIVIFSRYYGF